MSDWNRAGLASSVVAVVQDAQREANDLGEDYISTEHLLLALTRQSDSRAAQLLGTWNISMAQVHAQIYVDRCSSYKPDATLKMTPRAERILQIARTVARDAGCPLADTHHLLAALLLEGEGLAARVLRDVGLEAETLTAAVSQSSCD